MAGFIFDPTRKSTAAEHTLGYRAQDEDGSEYVYVQASGAIAANLVCKVEINGQANTLITNDADDRACTMSWWSVGGVEHIALTADNGEGADNE